MWVVGGASAEEVHGRAKENNRRELREGHVLRVREEDQEVIVELELEKLYLEYEEKSYKELTDIMEGQSVLPKELFSSMLAKIYKRTK